MLLSHLRHQFGRLLRDRRGNVLMIMGFAIIPLTFSTGMAVDYARAARLQTKINAIADAAALAAVTTPMMSQSGANACSAVRRMFVNQIGGINGLTLDPDDATQLTISVNDNGSTTNCSATRSSSSTSYARTSFVTWSAKSQNSFAGVLGVRTLAIGGTSESKAVIAPNIDFYVLLDTSPSMAIAATQAGIDTMVMNTSQQGGCAFGCHQTSTNGNDNKGNPAGSDGKLIDNYQLARNLGVTLRTDLVSKAAANMMDVAKSAAQSNGAIYRMSVSTFDTAFNTVQRMTTDLAAAKTAANGVQMQVVCKENELVCGTSNDDKNTNFTAMQNGLTAILTAPGGGTNNANDKPQGIIFIVTDGVRDEVYNGVDNNRWIGELERTYPYASGTTTIKTPTAMDPQICENAKNNGYRIAILYTEYLPLPTNGFYNSYVKPFQAQIGNNLKACASPGLYYMVSTDGNISDALAQLFQAAVTTAHLTQ